MDGLSGLMGEGLWLAGRNGKGCGSGLSLAGNGLKVKSILKAVGIAGLVGASAFVAYAIKNPAILDSVKNYFNDNPEIITGAMKPTLGKIFKAIPIPAYEIGKMGRMNGNLAGYGKKLPANIKKFIHMNPTATLNVLKHLKKGKGSGLHLAGHGRKIGSKNEVWSGTATKTSGGLTKSDLMKNKKGKVVSKKRHALGKRNFKNIQKYSYKKKGKGLEM